MLSVCLLPAMLVFLQSGAVNPAASSAVDASAIKAELHSHPPQVQSLSPIFDPSLPQPQSQPPAANTNGTNAANHHQHQHHHPSHSHYHHSANGGVAQPTPSLPQQQQQQTAIPGPGGQLTPEQIQYVRMRGNFFLVLVLFFLVERRLWN